MTGVLPPFMLGLVACASAEPSASGASMSPDEPLGPDAPVAAVLEAPGEVHRHALIVPSNGRHLTYDLAFDADAVALMAQVWHRGTLVDQASGEAARVPRTIGVVPGHDYTFVVTRIAGPAPVPYGLAVVIGTEAWETEPNHGPNLADALPVGDSVQGRLTGDDDQFRVIPGPTAGHLGLNLDVNHGAIWVSAVWRGGSYCRPVVVEDRFVATFGVVPREEVVIVLRPLFGEPTYRLAVDEGPARWIVEPNDEPSTAYDLPAGVLARGRLEGGVDHVRITLPDDAGPHRLEVERAASDQGRLEVEVFDGTRRLVRRQARRMHAPLPPGSPATVVIRSVDGGSPTYTIQVTPTGR